MVRMPKNIAKSSSDKRFGKFLFIKNIRTSSFVYWVATLLTFGITLVIINMFLEKDTIIAGTDLSVALLLLNIILGIVFFILFLTSPKNKKNNKLPFYIKNAVLISIGYIFLNSAIFVGAGYKEKTNKLNNHVSSEIIISVSPTGIPTTTLIPTPTIKQKVIKRIEPTEVPSSDSFGDCPIHEKCGGGVRRMKKSECENAICCQIGNTWELYSNSDKCNSAQASSVNTTNQNATPQKVAFTTYYASIPGTYYCSQTAVNQLLNSQESWVKSDYEYMRSTCDDYTKILKSTTGSKSETTAIEILKSGCESRTEDYKNSQSKLNDYIRQFCP